MSEQTGRRVSAKSTRPPRPEVDPVRELLALFVLTYQQYTFEEARKLPYKDINLMLRIAREKETSHYEMLTHITHAGFAQADKGRGVKKLMKYLKERRDG